MSQFFRAAIMIADQYKHPDRSDVRADMLRELRDARHPTCVYYRFLHSLVRAFRPLDIIEIGTYVGVSAAHMAEPNQIWAHDDPTHGQCLRGTVVTVDVNPDAARCVEELPYFPNNLRIVVGDSLEVIDQVSQVLGDKADVLYIDGQHTFARAYQEYAAYRQLVRDRGLILIDDAGLPMDGDEMNVFWDAVCEPKERLDFLHPNVGFGIVEKRDEICPQPLRVALDRANSEIEKRRRS